MKNIIFKTGIFLISGIALLFSSCDDFLSTIPKGEKIPTTWTDYNAFIKNTNYHYNDPSQILVLMNDIYKSPSNLNSDPLTKINYMWDESGDRTIVNEADKFAYSFSYEAIFHWNLIIQDGPKLTECTEAQRNMLVAQAKVLRCMNFFHVVNYYAGQYTPENAATTRSIPLVTSPDINSSSPQVTLSVLFQFIVDDLLSAVTYLPEKGETVYHPTQACGYGMLARVYLAMSDYTNALKYARMALNINDQLYDWKTYYKQNQAKYDDPENFDSNYPAVSFENPENYIFRYASSQSQAYGIYGKTYGITLNRAALFEKGDLRLTTRWKVRTFSTGERLYTGIRGDRFNGGGMSSPEMYHIKAECLARQGKIKDAMDTLNILRKTRILEDNYKPLTANTTEEAVRYIIQDKANEFLQTCIPFWDLRRLNKDSKYVRTLTKTEDGETYTLKPGSHLWIMPFAISITGNPGNNPIEQNTPR